MGRGSELSLEMKAALEARFAERQEANRQERMRKNSETYASKQRAAGLKRISVWVPETEADDLRSYAANLCFKRTLPQEG